MTDQDSIMQATPETEVEKTDAQQAPEATEADAAYQSMEELLEQEVGFRGLRPGDIIFGTVESIDEHGALVNVGAKSEGLVPPEELGARNQEINVGDEIAVYVVDNGGRSGNIILSKKKADYERAWQSIIKAFESGEVLTAMVIDRVKGGLVVDLGMRGFLPASHVATKNVNALDRFVGQSIKLKVIEVDRARKRVVVSQKRAVEDEKKVRREQTITTLEEGQIRRGVVRRVTDYGAFVDLGGIDGLLHVTEMSWGRVNHPSDIVKPGQKIDVMVLKYDVENEKISLGLKQILPDPWQHIDQFYSVDDEVNGTVTRLVPFGAFVALDHGIEGIIPNSELADQRIRKPDDVVAQGQKIHVKIINIRPSERRMTLSLRQIERHEEDEEVAAYSRRSSGASMTIGEMVGDVFSGDDEKAEELTDALAQVEEEEIPDEEETAEEIATTDKAETVKEIETTDEEETAEEIETTDEAETVEEIETTDEAETVKEIETTDEEETAEEIETTDEEETAEEIETTDEAETTNEGETTDVEDAADEEK